MALASARPLLSAFSLAFSPARRHVASIRSKSTSPPARDTDDSEKFVRPRSLIERFRDRRALKVTDITGSEWCEKQTELGLVCKLDPIAMLNWKRRYNAIAASRAYSRASSIRK